MKNYPHFKIIVLDDNEFYNKIITKYTEDYLEKLALLKNFTFEINSFTTYNDCVRNIGKANIIITDYYLNNGFSAVNILELIKNKNIKCKVIIISQIENINTSTLTILQGACEFIHKDKNALKKSCEIVEEIINSTNPIPLN